jgi:hypothetical protein
LSLRRTTSAWLTIGFDHYDGGHVHTVKNMPSPARAERNQRRKLAFIPMWPLVAAIALIVILIVVLR